MLVFKLPDGGLWIHGALKLPVGECDRLKTPGEPRVMVVCSYWHLMHERLYRKRWPNLLALCPTADRKGVERDCPVDGSVEDHPLTGVTVHQSLGHRLRELTYELALPDGGRALVFADLLFNLPHQPGIRGWIYRVARLTGRFEITWVDRLLISNRSKFDSYLKDLSALQDLRLLAFGHGDAIMDRPAERLSDLAGS